MQGKYKFEKEKLLTKKLLIGFFPFYFVQLAVVD